MYRDPVFEEVARREETAQRTERRQMLISAQKDIWRTTPEYRALRRQHILRLMHQVMHCRL